MAVNVCTFVKLVDIFFSNLLKYFLRLINYSVVCFQGYDSLKQIIILLNGKIMHVIEWVTVNGDGKKLRHLKSQKINMFQSFSYIWELNLVFICPTLCHLKTTCLLLMKQKLYALDAFFIEKLKLSENDPSMHKCNRLSLHQNKYIKLHFN